MGFGVKLPGSEKLRFYMHNIDAYYPPPPPPTILVPVTFLRMSAAVNSLFNRVSFKVSCILSILQAIFDMHISENPDL